MEGVTTKVPVEFVGHHLADEIPLPVDKIAARRALGLPEEGRIVALLPGSRASEVERMGELFMRTAVYCLEQDPSLHFIIPAASPDRYRQLHIELTDYVDFSLELINGHSHEAMAAADAIGFKRVIPACL